MVYVIYTGAIIKHVEGWKTMYLKKIHYDLFNHLGYIVNRYKEVGLTKPPDKGDNGVHASASPFEGLAELHNWMGKNIIDVEFGKALLSRGLTVSLLSGWFRDPIVKYPEALENGKTEGSLFDYVEDTDATSCMDLLVKLYDAQLNEEAVPGGCRCIIS